MTSTALLLVDLQNEFLDRAGLSPPRDALIERAGRLVEGCRALRVPVFHVHFVSRAAPDDRMPHFRRDGRWPCLEGTAAAAPPERLAPRAGEPVFEKRVWSPFEGASEPALVAALEALGVRRLVVAGVFLHACVRETAIDAYQRGFEVWVAADAVGSTELLHAHVTAAFLASRMIAPVSTADVLARLGGAPGRGTPGAGDATVGAGGGHRVGSAALAVPPPAAAAPPAGAAPRAPLAPVAWVDGAWRAADPARHLVHERANPARLDEVVARVGLAGAEDIDAALAAATRTAGAWARTPPDARAARIDAWADAIARRRDALAATLAMEIGKPVREGLSEVDYAVALCRGAARRAATAEAIEPVAEGIHARRRPLGVVLAVTPWNNPLAIPVGKLAPALALGNACVWKPALEAPGAAIALVEALVEAGLPHGVLDLVLGDGATALRLLADPRVAAVTLTGSASAGRQAGALAADLLKPFQAELGGNNAAIVLGGGQAGGAADLDRAAVELAASAFGFAGQRCTATRRVIVEQGAAIPFRARFLAAARALVVGDPSDAATEIGPVVSRASQRRLEALLAAAAASGARVERVEIAAGLAEAGAFVAPALVSGADPESPIVQEESFGPVCVVEEARDLEHALALANGVRQGLVASLYGGDPAARARFLDAVECGLLKLDQPTRGAHPEAPFGGCKASSLGPPEHGRWDLDAFTRVQAVYESPR